MRQIRSIFRSSRTLCRSACTLYAAALAGCAGTTAAVPVQERIVVERAAQYLAARQAGDVDTAYGLLAPSQRAVTSKEQFVGRHGERSTLPGGDLYSVVCEGEHCVLRRGFRQDFPLPLLGSKRLPMTSYLNENWVQEDGRWWILAK